MPTPPFKVQNCSKVPFNLDPNVGHKSIAEKIC